MDVSFSIDPILDKTLELEVEGWEKLVIFYSVELVSNVSFLFWKIKGTEHIFRIPTRIVYENHGLNYGEHFSLTLKVFREDYLSWKNSGFPEDWMKRYKQQFQFLIKT